MQCLRCEGWIVQDRFFDLLDDTGRLYCEGWRCVNCGAIIDAVILRHQRRARQTATAIPSHAAA